MSQETLRAVHPPTERRPAVWPWVLMPLAALALFALLYSVRHSRHSGPAPGASATAPEGSGDTSGL
ncbi:MAG TPA: hypothetical protein VMU40_09285 [Steroidobacteraceae bacterium]|nr:hypothetical protein [Steroidobacteraceae bacterium]